MRKATLVNLSIKWRKTTLASCLNCTKWPMTCLRNPKKSNGSKLNSTSGSACLRRQNRKMQTGIIVSSLRSMKLMLFTGKRLDAWVNHLSVTVAKAAKTWAQSAVDRKTWAKISPFELKVATRVPLTLIPVLLRTVGRHPDTKVPWRTSKLKMRQNKKREIHPLR